MVNYYLETNSNNGWTLTMNEPKGTVLNGSAGFNSLSGHTTNVSKMKAWALSRWNTTNLIKLEMVANAFFYQATVIFADSLFTRYTQSREFGYKWKFHAAGIQSPPWVMASRPRSSRPCDCARTKPWRGDWVKMFSATVEKTRVCLSSLFKKKINIFLN